MKNKCILILEGLTIIRALEIDILKNLKIEINGQWLDLGSGINGSPEYNYLCKNKNASVVNSDINATNNTYYINLEEKLPYSNQEFEGISLFHVLQYIYNSENLIKELYRVSKSTILIVTPYSLNYAPENGVDLWRPREDYYNKVLSTLLLTEKKVIPILHGPFIYLLSIIEIYFLKYRYVRFILFIFFYCLDLVIYRILPKKTSIYVSNRSVIGYVVYGKK
ncbi:hypothetical protein [Polynucleobacter kasalickyi]|uniref:Methyltransferase type 11 domain-containing protein n=1 Tax=Polynucleobacter kasalickyi TaxID=1938817 RepID=A0A1W2CA34_9BURK|nr:hypothetical protein [Polynucleobacter kasalickyi]SMC82030.1 hypothetical protein SAMN06296008_1219 [Polynucleobacter kasalickyi]